LLALAAFWWKAQPVDDELLDKRTLEALDQLLAKTRFTMFPFLPSYWLSSSVLQWAEGVLRGAAFFALVLLSHTLFFGGIAFTRFGNACFTTPRRRCKAARAADGNLVSRPSKSKPRPPAGLLEKIAAKFSWLDRDTRALAVKDLRMFWRDTTQWGQSVMLFGLLGVYIINLRNFTHQLTSPFWVNLVAFLNLGVLAEPRLGDDAVCVPAIFARRPAAVDHRHGADGHGARGQNQILAGQRPVALRHVRPHHAVLLSAQNELGPRAVFWRGDHRDDVRAQRLAIGLGVLYPNLKEANPNKIVSGFGGTLCFVLSSFYILASVLLLVFGAAGLHARAKLGGGRHHRLCAAVRLHRLAAAEIWGCNN
jgi:ABC-2 type transport system permease protein